MKIIKGNDKITVQLAIEYLKNGKAISFKTDTVYGLAVDAKNEEAVEKLYKIKGRDRQKPVAIFLSDEKKARDFLVFDELSREICDRFVPGPITVILKKNSSFDDNIAKNININDDFIGFRVVKTKFLDELFEKFDGVLAVTSANLSGIESCLSAEEVIDSFKDVNYDILLIDEGKTLNRIASTVVKIDNNNLEILREGVIKKEEILK